MLRNIISTNLISSIIAGGTTILFCFILVVAVSALYEARKQGNKKTIAWGVIFVVLLLVITVIIFTVTLSLFGIIKFQTIQRGEKSIMVSTIVTFGHVFTKAFAALCSVMLFIVMYRNVKESQKAGDKVCFRLSFAYMLIAVLVFIFIPLLNF